MSDDDEVTEMVVTLCQACGGSGELPDGLECDEYEAFYDDEDRHVVPVESLDDEDDLEPVVETGPESGGHDPVASTAPAETIADGWPADKIGVVTVGDDTGLAHKVTRALGGDGPFLMHHADMVAEWQYNNTPDEPTGVVVGKTWAMVMPDLKVGDSGWAVYQLCKALGVPAQREMDRNLMALAVDTANSDFIDNMDPDADVAAALAGYTFDTIDWLAVL